MPFAIKIFIHASVDSVHMYDILIFHVTLRQKLLCLVRSSECFELNEFHSGREERHDGEQNFLSKYWSLLEIHVGLGEYEQHGDSGTLWPRLPRIILHIGEIYSVLRNMNYIS